MAEVELPAVLLAPAVLAYQAVQPALDAAGEAEVAGVYGQHQGLVEHSAVKPVGQDQLDAQWPAIRCGEFLPLVDPGETVQPPAGGFANRGGHAGGLQAIQGGSQTLVVALRGATTDEAQDLVGRCPHQPRGGNPRIPRFDDLAGRPDQDIGIPDRGDAMFPRALDPHRHLAGAEVDWHAAARFRQREEWVRHQILRVAWSHVARQGTE